MTDVFTKVGLGDAIYEVLVIPCEATATVTKGDVVVATTHAVDKIVTVSPAGALGAVDGIGVAMENIAIGAIGKVLKIGVIKVTADDAVTAGERWMPGGTAGVAPMTAAGTTVADLEASMGRALQDLAVGDTGLVTVGIF